MREVKSARKSKGSKGPELGFKVLAPVKVQEDLLSYTKVIFFFHDTQFSVDKLVPVSGSYGVHRFLQNIFTPGVSFKKTQIK